MNREQTAHVVGYLVAAGALRPVEGQVAVWFDLIGGLDYGTAQVAARRVVMSGERFATPAVLAAEVKRVRDDRLANTVPPAPPVPLPVDDDLAWRRAYLEARADGRDDEGACAWANGKVRIELPAPADEMPIPPVLRRRMLTAVKDVPV